MDSHKNIDIKILKKGINKLIQKNIEINKQIYLQSFFQKKNKKYMIIVDLKKFLMDKSKGFTAT